MTAGLAVAAASALLLVTSPPTPASTDGAATASRRSTATVRIPAVTFLPQTLSVRKGTTVVWSNSSHTSHSATRRGAFDTGVIKPGGSAAIRFSRQGTFSYFCTVHPFMHGKVVVH